MESIPKPLQIASKTKKQTAANKKWRKIAQFAKFHQKIEKRGKKLRKKLANHLDF